jgi:glutathione S-transferase
MTDEIVFFTHPQSRGRTVRWMLEEVGRPYRTELLEYGTTMKAAAFLAINPMGKVPALTHRGVVVTEGAAICAYLADAFPEAGLAPAPGDPARGPYYRWLFMAAGPVEAAFFNRSMGWEVPPERTRAMGYGSYGQIFDALEGELEGRTHLVGDRFSAADLYLGSVLGFGMRFGLIEKRPAFETYVAGLFSRPACVRAAAIDDALVQPQPA